MSFGLKRLLSPQLYSGTLVGNAGLGVPVRLSVTFNPKTAEVTCDADRNVELTALENRICIFNASDSQNQISGFKISNSRVLLVRLRRSHYYLKDLSGQDPSN
jgi:hypothetical protein